jgi:hypothetical protein
MKQLPLGSAVSPTELLISEVTCKKNHLARQKGPLTGAFEFRAAKNRGFFLSPAKTVADHLFTQ